MQTIDESGMDESRIQEIKNIELKELFLKYTNKEEKKSIEETSCSDFGSDDFINFNKAKEIKSLEWKSILKFNIFFLSSLQLICIYDLLTLESKLEFTYICITIFSLVIVALFILFQKIKTQNQVAFTLVKEGILLNNRLLEWNKSQCFLYRKDGQPYLLVKPIQEEEIIISLYFLKHFPTRIICWIDKYKTNYAAITKKEHSN